MPHIWRVVYTEYTDIGAGYGKNHEVDKNDIFITNTKNLDEIEEKKRIIHKPGNRLYQHIKIHSAEYIGDGYDLQNL